MMFDDPRAEATHRKKPPNHMAIKLSAVFGLLLVAITISRYVGWLPEKPVWNGSRAATTPETLPPSVATSPTLAPNSGGFTPLESVPSNPVFAFNQPSKTSPVQTVEPPVRVVENSNAERRAMAKSRVLGLQQLGRDVRDSLTRAEQLIGDWSQRTEKLLDDDDGRKLATQPDLVERFDVLASGFAERPVTKANVTSWREQLAALVEPLVLPVENAQEVVMPGAALESDLLALQRAITDRTKELRDSFGGLNSVLAASRDLKPGERTLRQAIATLQDERQKKLVDAKVSGQRKADEAARSVIERAEQDKHSAEVALDVAKKNAVAAGLQKQVTDLNDAVARKRRLERVRAQIQQHLEPFISPGFSQPREMAGTFMDVTQTKEKKPMSLSGLRKIGALNDSEDGMRRLYRAASSFSNDRPLWSEAYNHELTVKAHELMLKYGEDMVAEGWLSP